MRGPRQAPLPSKPNTCGLMNENRLFRQEVFESQRNRYYGSVSINTPPHYSVLTVGFTVLVMCVFLFLMFGEFSEKFIVIGYLESTRGVARVYPSKNGVIVRRYIKQGERVKKGDKLFLIDTSYQGLDIRNKHDVLAQLEKKRASITAEMGYKEKHLQELKKLLEKKYISLSTFYEKKDDFVALERQKTGVEVEIINVNHEKSYVIRSPIDGVISSVIYQEGQYTNLAKPMAKILPLHADLMAELFIPVRQSGFLHRKNKVTIRFDAYPYARFGTSTAKISEISKSILTDDEEDKPIRIGQPYYKATALLDKQFVTVYGKHKTIQHGMTISAVIVGSKRRIWQWILDPLFSFYGDVFV